MRGWGYMGKVVLGISLLLVVTLVAAACGGDDEELAAPAPAAPAAPAAEAEAVTAMAEEPEQPAAAAPAVAAAEAAAPEMEAMAVQRGTLRSIHTSWWGGQETLDPVAASTWEPPRKLVYDRLIILDEFGSPTPSLATAWEIDDTLTKWTFNIREGVTFTDGSTMTSRDVVFTMEHILDPNVGGQAASLLTMLDPNGFETPDDYTVVMNLTSAHVDLPLILRHVTIRVLPEGITREFMVREANGTGPYAVEHISVDGLSTFVSKDDHWEGLPGTERVTVVLITGADARVQALLADQIDYATSLTVAQVLQVEGNDEYYIQENGRGSQEVFVPLAPEPPFTDIRVRQALKAVVDPEQMIAIAVQGHGQAACNNPVRSTDQYYWPADCPQDIDLAISLLAEAGYPDGLSLELITSDLLGSWIPMTTVYKEQAALAGIDIDIKLAPADGYWSDVWQIVPFSVSVWSYKEADQILNEGYRCGASWTEGHWCNEQYDGFLDAARAEPDFNARKLLYQQAQELLVAEAPVIIPFNENRISAISTRVQTWQPWWFAAEEALHHLTVDLR